MERPSIKIMTIGLGAIILAVLFVGSGCIDNSTTYQPAVPPESVRVITEQEPSVVAPVAPVISEPSYTPPPSPAPTPTYYAPQAETIPDTGSRYCCKYCSKGKACGDSCISRSYTCHKPPGCACNK